MIESGYPLPRDELKGFLKAASQATGLTFSYVPPESKLQDLIVGDSAFCLQVKATGTGADLCQASLEKNLDRAASQKAPIFSLCHARMGQVIMPLRTEQGVDLGTVIAGHAVVEELTEEHREHIRSLALSLGMENA
ncbi:MAG: PocR ligand-binding domain-containing protein, partial [bacterium]